MSVEESFHFWLPISKAASDKDGKARMIEGIASTPALDLQNERVVQNGIDFNYFLKHGYFNWDHKSGADNKIGEPQECRITPKGLYVKGLIYKGKKVADAVWEHITALANDPNSNRKVGFSLQGKTVRRNGNSILRCWIQDIAITTAPINYNTYLDIVKSLDGQSWCNSEELSNISDTNKSLAAGHSPVLANESLDSNAKVQLFGSSDKNKDEEDENGKNKKITKKSLAHLVSSNLGYSQETSNILTDILFDLSADRRIDE
tara:strand:- start:1492 stop:2274 length:783 start_codon:yes stop_codon:yes gene_type:complete